MTRLRLAALAAATVFLTLVSSSALALWSSSAQVTSIAKAATIGITQTIPAPIGLARTYSTTSLAGASPVTLQNTGNREANWTLSLIASSTNAPTLPAAVAVKAAVVANAAACTAAATLPSPTTGALSTTTAFAATGSFAAGASVIVCVQTSMTSANVTALAEKTMTIAVSSRSTIGTTWVANSATVSIVQNVASALLFFTDWSGQYRIFNQGVCLGREWETTAVLKNFGCTETDASRWRITTDTNGSQYIALVRSGGNPVNPNWAMSSENSGLATTTYAASANRRWKIEARGTSGTYRIVNEQFNKCVSVTATLHSYGGYPVVGTATCDDASAAQGFTFTVIGSPVPTTPNVATCSGGNNLNWIVYSWPAAVGYQSEIDYKVYVGGVLIVDHPDGDYTSQNLFNNENPLVTVTGVGTGVKVVEIKQSIAGSPWVTSAIGSMYIQPGTNNLKCAP